MVAISTDRLTKVFDDGTVAVDDVSFAVEPGQFLVLLGPTGCGKSTILRLVAGLETPTSGHVLIDGEIVDSLSAQRRQVAMVFQDYALYPHLTVAQNIAFPLRLGQGAAVEARIRQVAAELGVVEHLHRLPTVLSGGQRQRVAMARAIVREPKAFLLDEPLANLDARLRAELRADVTGLARRHGVTTVYVTHDQAEALSMADRLAVLRRGRLQQIGPPAEVYGDPANLFVAAFLGNPRTSLLQGAVYAEPDRIVVDLGGQTLDLPVDDPRLAGLAGHHTERVIVALRADALRPVVADGPAVAPAAGTLRGTVRTVENLGHEALVRLDTGAMPAAPAESQLDLPDPDVHLAELLAEDLPAGRHLRDTIARIVPQQRRPDPPATARTPYGFYPVYEPDPQEPDPGTEADVVVRVPAPALPVPGESMTVAVDLDRLLLFDRAGARIRLG
ncbi:ABC transporter ATP-binding protein [Micromonospora sp. NBC_01813]|uniref:ABC transporter ATP-binding protein n=1 Tax=Micromonospora sp. NBC_01813 TaxID=2975988 RepID=UPI002DD8B570|nr:ABC transporter ATP-binding protein [Micromonospora sp. NBC_01813]WSA12201.1 ABC transporter ATP-binding protein [Micromonospora sp. NBC_01813]